jgi:hypothetical protein
MDNGCNNLDSISLNMNYYIVVENDKSKQNIIGIATDLDEALALYHSFKSLNEKMIYEHEINNSGKHIKEKIITLYDK